MRPGDANVDEAYHVDADQMGVDEVGSFPADQSPFGVLDLGGNVREWVQQGTGRVGRGGIWSHESLHARAAFRSFNDGEGDADIGVRVCAPAPRTR
jgi:formylglycine-generating enzyme required for sulfatase activity